MKMIFQQRHTWVLLAVLMMSLIGAASISYSDEGMWLFSNPPRKILKEKYNFEPTDSWLEHLQKSAVRFNSGGSGSFVSVNGLVMTNHHVGADALAKLSTPEHDYLNDGFRAKTTDEEVKCLDLELNVLMKIEDVTDRVMKAVTDDMKPDEAVTARRKVISTIEGEAKEKTGLRSDVVTLYQGAQYHLYSYKQYTDVRLVFAPEQDAAFFGGDPDNFEYPRYDLDICFFRAYENDKPVKVEHFLKWSAAGAKEGELTFVAGHPGKTDRQNTVGHLEFMRDWTIPWQLNILRRKEIMLNNYYERDSEHALQAQDDLFGVQNSRKARLGNLAGLQDPAVMDAKRSAENSLLKFLASKQEMKDAVDAVGTVKAKLEAIKPFYFDVMLLEREEAFRCSHFEIARDLVRYAYEKDKAAGEQLPEYGKARLESMKQKLFSEAPMHQELEIAKLADSLSLYMEMQGGEGWTGNKNKPESLYDREELLKKVFDGKSPRVRAAELIRGSKLSDVAERKKLFDGGKSAIEASSDTMIQLAILVDDASRVVRKKYESDLDEPLRQAYSKIATARFAQQGTSSPPDATFTLRLAFGEVKGYTTEEGKQVPPWTTLGGAFEHAEKHGNVEPFALPESWHNKKDKMKLDTPYNFVTTADIIGGNSGSPVVNRDVDVVGIIFDGNIQSLVLDVAYSDKIARAVSVHSAGIMETLKSVYEATELVNELQGKGK